jgi:hypothetical protein
MESEPKPTSARDYSSEDEKLRSLKDSVRRMNDEIVDLNSQVELMFKVAENFKITTEQQKVAKIDLMKEFLNEQCQSYVEFQDGTLMIVDKLNKVTELLKDKRSFDFTSSELVPNSLLDYALTLYQVKKDSTKGITGLLSSYYQKRPTPTWEFREALKNFISNASGQIIDSLEFSASDFALIDGNFKSFIAQYNDIDKKKMSVYEISKVARFFKFSKDRYKEKEDYQDVKIDLKKIIKNIQEEALSFSQHAHNPKTAHIIIANDGHMAWNASSLQYQYQEVLQKKFFDIFILCGCGSRPLDANASRLREFTCKLEVLNPKQYDKIEDKLESFEAEEYDRFSPLELEHVVVKIMSHDLKIALDYISQIEKMQFGKGAQVIYLLSGDKVDIHKIKLNNTSYLIAHNINLNLRAEKCLFVPRIIDWIRQEQDCLKGVLRCYIEFEDTIPGSEHTVFNGRARPKSIPEFYDQLSKVGLLPEDENNFSEADYFGDIMLGVSNFNDGIVQNLPNYNDNLLQDQSNIYEGL